MEHWSSNIETKFDAELGHKIDKEVRQALRPINLMQNLVLNPRYQIKNDVILPNNNKKMGKKHSINDTHEEQRLEWTATHTAGSDPQSGACVPRPLSDPWGGTGSKCFSSNGSMEVEQLDYKRVECLDH
ncbi:hypothetical protein HF086_006397 [Spodoptera exigua]|uniref:Uncharacterized protein n=1 Tax=Spodoptera exigua TaxID=7107 RepID=A0A922MX10_SPOEX|nr:hypothetical protein HF086_006397 [Spodoptera exigua]